MLHLLLAVVSISLLAAFSVVAISRPPEQALHTPAAALEKQAIFLEAIRGLERVETGVILYFEFHRDATGTVIYPGNGVDMKSLIAPGYAFWPADVRGTYTWEARASNYLGESAVYVCLKPIAAGSKEGQAALIQIRDLQPSMPVYAGAACGATSNAEGGQYLTSWLILTPYDLPPLDDPPPDGSPPDRQPGCNVHSAECRKGCELAGSWGRGRRCSNIRPRPQPEVPLAFGPSILP